MGRACNPLFRPGPFLWKRDVFLKEPSRVTARTQRIRIGRPPRLHKHGEVPCLPRKPSSSIVPSLRLICFLLERDTHTRHGDMLVYTDLLTGERPPSLIFPFFLSVFHRLGKHRVAHYICLLVDFKVLHTIYRNKIYLLTRLGCAACDAEFTADLMKS
jgi:hypothetical protein